MEENCDVDMGITDVDIGITDRFQKHLIISMNNFKKKYLTGMAI